MARPATNDYERLAERLLAERRKRRPWLRIPRLRLRPFRVFFDSDLRDALAALAWYAESANWRPVAVGTEQVGDQLIHVWGEAPVKADAGAKARVALGFEPGLEVKWWRAW